MAQIDTFILTKTAEKPYPMGQPIEVKTGPSRKPGLSL